MYRIEVFNMDLETDTQEAKTRDKAVAFELCLNEIYRQLRQLVKYESDKTAEDAYRAFLDICQDYGVDPIG